MTQYFWVRFLVGEPLLGVEAHHSVLWMGICRVKGASDATAYVSNRLLFK